MPSPYPKLENGDDVARPFRLWDAKQNAFIRYRWYRYPRRAHLGALIEAFWSAPGTVIEVIDVRVGKLLGQYRRTGTNITLHAIQHVDDGPEAQVYHLHERLAA